MAKGQESKNIVSKKILEVFEGSFAYDKEIRIPMIENGEEIQIKVTLTAAKVAVTPGSENAVPTAAPVDNNRIDFIAQPVKDTIVEPTAEEKENVKNLLKSLGL